MRGEGVEGTGDTYVRGTVAARVEGVVKSFHGGGGPTRVLDGIDLSVRRGECVFLVGPSGSGKTTLLSILGCILTADRGRVQILGEETTELDAKARAALRLTRLGFVFQRFQLIRGLAALEQVCIPLSLRGVAPAQARRRGLDLLAAVGLEGKDRSLPTQLSTGQCQRVALARALAGDPELILADEPTASLDAANGREMMALLRRLTAEEGKAAVVVTHDARIFPFADHILKLEGGRIATDGDRE